MGLKPSVPASTRKLSGKKASSEKKKNSKPKATANGTGTLPQQQTATLERQEAPKRRRPVPPPPPPEEEPFIVRALFDFLGTRDDDLPFMKGDRMEVDNTKRTGDWWMARHLLTKKWGYIPSNYVCKDDNSPESQDWWFDFDRNQAETMLLLPGNKTGTFIVRKSTDGKSYVLSIRSLQPNTDEPSTKHYRIRKLDSGHVYIHPSSTFSCLVALVEHYRGRTEGLCCQLTEACPRILPVRHFEELEIKREAVEFKQKLGAGCFGEVLLGKLYGKVDVAIKTLKPGTMSSDAFLEEARVMNQLRHPNLVQLMAVCTSSKPFLIISEFCVNGSLLDYLRKDRGKVVRFPIMVAMAGQIAAGMAYLETKNYIHRDLRAANILVGEHYEVKVADFGLARLVEEDIYKAQEGSKFPIKWTAPEAMQIQKFSSKSDVWSFGVVLFELITCGAHPYAGMTNHEVLYKVTGPEKYRLPRPYSSVPYPASYYDIMLQCWREEPEDRPTFSHLHNVFDDFLVNTEEQYGEADGD